MPSRVLAPAFARCQRSRAAAGQQLDNGTYGRSRNARIVYSTGTGRICPGCGWPERDCKCSKTAATESVPGRIVAKLRVEKKGRGGKTVTVVFDLPQQRRVSQESCRRS